MTFRKYPKIKRIGHESNSGILESGTVLVQEKLDGANFRFTWDAEDERLVFGSRNIEYWNEKDIDKNFIHAVEFVRDQINMDSVGGMKNLVVFGEAMHPHTLDYNWEQVPSFLGFGVYDQIHEEWWRWQNADHLFEELGLPTVPVLCYGPASDVVDALDWNEEILVPESLYRDGQAEGVVIKNEETGQKAKYRTQEFKERHNSQSVSNPDDYDPEDSVILARQYTTEARVLKMIHKYRDRGRTIEMGIMEDLWRDVFDDIIEEEYDTIFLGNHTIDTKQFRSEVASITANVLESYLSRPDDSVLNAPQ